MERDNTCLHLIAEEEAPEQLLSCVSQFAAVRVSELLNESLDAIDAIDAQGDALGIHHGHWSVEGRSPLGGRR